MLYEYLPILIFLALASLFATVMLSAGFVFGGSNPDDEKIPLMNVGLNHLMILE